MGSAVKLPVFMGAGNEEPGQFWFMVRAIWETQGITDENIKNATLVSVLQDCTLTWYIKYSSDHPNAGIMAIQDALDKEFGRPKSETQSVIGFKGIAMLPGETQWIWIRD